MIVSALTLSLTGCAGVKSNAIEELPMPNRWSVETAGTMGACPGIDGNYQVHGWGRDSEGAPLMQTRLDATLGHAFPSSSLPEQIKIAVDESSKSIVIHFGHPVNKSISEPSECSEGWYRVVQNEVDQYVGDGTNLDYSIRHIDLGRSVEGSLIVHLRLEAQFSSFLFFKSKEKSDIWSIYEQIQNK